MKVQRDNCWLLFLRVLTIIPSIISFSYINYWICKKQFDFCHKKDNSVLIAIHYFSRKKMATLRSKRKLPALNKENCEEHPRSNLAQNSNFPRSQEDYFT